MAGGSASFADAFNDALADRQMSLAGLQRSLAARGAPVSLAALSYWRSGQRQPERERSLLAVAEIEQILMLFPGELENRLERRRHRMNPHTLATLSDSHEQIRRMLADIDFVSPSDALIDRSVTIKYALDESGSPRSCTYIVEVEAIQDLAERRATLLRVTPHAPPPVITALGGYELGRVRHDPEAGLVVAEMLLDRPLLVGETAMLEQQIEYQANDPDDNTYFYWAVRKMTSVSLWIRFHPDLLPERCEWYTKVNGQEEVTDIETFGSSVSRTLTNFGPGTLGFRWFWD